MIRRIAIGNDHGGYFLKVAIAKHLRDKGYELLNMGSDSQEIVRYPYYAAKVIRELNNGSAQRGILICSTGIGMSIIANKYKGIRAALCCNVHMAKMTSSHNKANVICLGGKVIGENLAIDMVDSWLSTEYSGGRHDISLNMIEDAENSLCTGGNWIPEEDSRCIRA